MRSRIALSVMLALTGATAVVASPLRVDQAMDYREERAFAEIEGAGEVVNSTTVFTESYVSSLLLTLPYSI